MALPHTLVKTLEKASKSECAGSQLSCAISEPDPMVQQIRISLAIPHLRLAIFTKWAEEPNGAVHLTMGEVVSVEKEWTHLLLSYELEGVR